MRVGDPIRYTTQLLGFDERRFHFFHRMWQMVQRGKMAEMKHAGIVAYTKPGTQLPVLLYFPNIKGTTQGEQLLKIQKEHPNLGFCRISELAADCSVDFAERYRLPTH
jgi:hypothetical protein